MSGGAVGGPSSGEARLERMRRLPVGDRESFTKTVAEAEAYLLAGLTLDPHPLWTDEPVARAAAGGRMVPPALLVAMVSGVLSRFAGRVPPPGAVSYRYDLRASKPARFGDTVTAELRIAAHLPERYEVLLDARCVNQRGEVVLAGECVLKVL